MSVSNRKLDIPVSDTMRTVMGRLNEQGKKPLIVGGAVRDALLGEKPKDIDVEVYNANYDELSDTLSKHGRVNLVGKQFGVVKFTDPQGNDYDFSIPRRDNKSGVGHRDFQVDFDPSISPQQAASRRDFTFNALAYDPVENKLHDYFHGERDLQAKLLHHTSDAFTEDPLRVLRGMQFSARYGLDLSDDTAEASKNIAHEYDSIPRERVSEEWMKLATKGKQPGRAIHYLMRTGWIDNFPHLANLVDVPQEPEWHPEGAAHIHTALAMDAAAKVADRENLHGDDRAVTVLGAMCHDLGKVTETQRTKGKDGVERWTSHGHDTAGGPLARETLEGIGIKPDIVNKVQPIVENHMQHLNFKDEGGSARAVRRLAERLKPANITELSRVIESDHSARPPLEGGMPKSAQRMLEFAGRSRVTDSTMEPLVKGRDILPFFNNEPGPHIGEHYKAAYEAQLNGEINTPQEAAAWLHNRFSKTGSAKGVRVYRGVNIPDPEKFEDIFKHESGIGVHWTTDSEVAKGFGNVVLEGEVAGQHLMDANEANYRYLYGNEAADIGEHPCQTCGRPYDAKVHEENHEYVAEDFNPGWPEMWQVHEGWGESEQPIRPGAPVELHAVHINGERRPYRRTITSAQVADEERLWQHITTDIVKTAGANVWDGFPFDERTGQEPGDKDTSPERTDEGHFVLYHGTSPEGAESILKGRSFHPDDFGMVGFGTTPEAARIYGIMKSGPDAKVIRAVIDKDWIAGQRATREIGGSGYNQFLVGGPHGHRDWEGVPSDAVREVGVNGGKTSSAATGQCEHKYPQGHYDRRAGDFVRRCQSPARKVVDGKQLCSIHAYEAGQKTPKTSAATDDDFEVVFDEGKGRPLPEPGPYGYSAQARPRD